MAKSPGFSASTTAFASGPMQSGAKATGLPRAFGSASATGFCVNSRFFLPFGRPRWLRMITFAPLSGQLLQRRHRAVDAGRVGDLAVLHRHVEVDAHQDALAGNVEVVDGS